MQLRKEIWNIFSLRACTERNECVVHYAQYMHFLTLFEINNSYLHKFSTKQKTKVMTV
jgi:hypothetical protein